MSKKLLDHYVSIYKALQDHGKFWTRWLGLRIMPVADGWLPEDEVAAARALKQALEELNKEAEKIGA